MGDGMADEHPSPGIYGVDYETYAGWPLINSGLIRAGGVSMRRMKWGFDRRLDSEDTRDRKFGRAFHCKLLEPDTFDFRFIVQEVCSATKKGDGQPCENMGVVQQGGNWFCRTKGHAPEGAEEPQDYVSREEIERVDVMIAELKDHKAIKMLRTHGGCEESAIAEINGVLCKGRFDKRLPGPGCPPTIIDLKKVRADKIHPFDCDRSIRNYQYDVQMALYCRIAKAITGEDHKGIWIFIADNPDYDVCARMMTQEQFQQASSRIDGTLHCWQRACEREDWPGVAPELQCCGEFHESILEDAA